jgi:hypothetical protein
MSQKSSSPTTNTRKASQCTQPTESVTTVKKQRKKETIPRASVLETECTEGTNGEAQKKDNIPRKEEEVETYQRQRTRVDRDNTKEKINDADRRTTQEDEGAKEDPSTHNN